MASAAGQDLIEKRDEKNVLTRDSSILPFLLSLLSPMTKTNNHNITIYVCRCHVYSFRHLFQPQTLLDSSGEVILNIPEHFPEFPVHTTRTTGTMEKVPSVSSSDTLAAAAWEMEASSTSTASELEGTDTYSTYCELLDELPEEQGPEIQEAIFQSSRASLTNENDRYYHRSEMCPCFTLPSFSCTVPGVNRCSQSAHLPVQQGRMEER